MFATLGQAKRHSRLKEVAAACPDSAEFISLVNEATERMLKRGDWPGVVVPIHVCSFAGCVAFPRYVGQVRKLNVCRHPVPIRNLWWDFFEDRHRPNWISWCGQECMMIDGQYSPVLQDVMGDGRQLRAYPQVKADVGKYIRIFGEDNNGQVLRTNNGNGTWDDGIRIRLVVPYGTNLKFVRRIDRVLIDEGMQGDLFLYAFNTTTGETEFISTYQPGDINPSFVRNSLRIPNCQTSTTGTCGQSKPLVALVKLKFIPAVVDTDLVLIEDMSALKLMIQSIKAEEAGDELKARQKEKSAIREMNLRMQNEMPDDQIPIDLGETGGTSVGVQQCF